MTVASKDSMKEFTVYIKGLPQPLIIIADYASNHTVNGATTSMVVFTRGGNVIGAVNDFAAWFESAAKE